MTQVRLLVPAAFYPTGLTDDHYALHWGSFWVEHVEWLVGDFALMAVCVNKREVGVVGGG